MGAAQCLAALHGVQPWGPGHGEEAVGWGRGFLPETSEMEAARGIWEQSGWGSRNSVPRGSSEPEVGNVPCASEEPEARSPRVARAL